jgi:hypothetical protein
MFELATIQAYIEANVFYHEKWDEQTEQIRQVVVNNSEAILERELPHHFGGTKEIPIDIIVEQCLHILEFDDSHRRAEMGVSYFMASGLYVSFDKKFSDRSIAKTILHRFPRRKFGRYSHSRSDTFRGY